MFSLWSSPLQMDLGAQPEMLQLLLQGGLKNAYKKTKAIAKRKQISFAVITW